MTLEILSIKRDPDVTLNVLLNPVAWKAPTSYARRVGGRVVAATAPAPEVVTFQSALRDALAEIWEGLGRTEPITTDCRADFYFARRLEQYVSPSGRHITKHVVDATNLRKSAEDALQPTILKNDRCVQMGWTEIVEQSKTVAEPFVRIEIWVLE